MNRLGDMAHFPALVNAGATANIVLTISVTWLLVPHYPQIYAPAAWIAMVLCVNLLPVVLLRLTLKPDTVYRKLGEMDFVRDQHKFSDWVYLAASANMAFWILLCWSIFSTSHTTRMLLILIVVAAVATFSPVILRGKRSNQNV